MKRKIPKYLLRNARKLLKSLPTDRPGFIRDNSTGKWYTADEVKKALRAP